MNYLGFYLLTMLDRIQGTFNTIACLSCVAVALASVGLAFACAFEEGKKVSNFIKKYKKSVFWYLIVVISLATFIPTTKQAAFILIAPELIENGAVRETFKNIPELMQLGTEYLKEVLKEKASE